MGDLYPPGVRVCIQDLLKLCVDLLSGGQQLVQFRLAADAAQGGLSQLRNGVGVVLNLHDGLDGVDDPEIDHRINLHGNVVQGDHVLGIHIHGHQPHADPHHFIDHGDENDQARAFGLDDPAQTEK